jgi:hypothetical protein
MGIWTIVAILYAIGMVVAWFGFIRKWRRKTWEKVWFTVFWLPTFLTRVYEFIRNYFKYGWTFKDYDKYE